MGELELQNAVHVYCVYLNRGPHVGWFWELGAGFGAHKFVKGYFCAMQNVVYKQHLGDNKIPQKYYVNILGGKGVVLVREFEKVCALPPPKKKKEEKKLALRQNKIWSTPHIPYTEPLPFSLATSQFITIYLYPS